MTEEIKAALAAMATKIDGYQEDIKTLKSTVETLKAAPAASPVLPGVKANEVVYGRKLAYQGMALKGMTEQDKDSLCKYVLNVVEATKKNPNPEAVAFIQKTAMTEGSPGGGGYLVPELWHNAMLQYALAQSFALNECEVINMSSEILHVPAESGGVSVAWTAEAVDATESEPTFTEVKLTAKRLDAFAITSNELLNDNAYDIVSFLTKKFGECIGQEIDSQVLVGTGSPVSGILTAVCGYSVVMAAGTNFSAVTLDNLATAIASIPTERLTNAKFVMHRSVLNFLRTQKASSSGMYMWGNPNAGETQTIWGYPVIVSEKAPSTTGASSPLVLFGNLKNFLIGQRLGGATLDVDPFSLFKAYRTQFRIINRYALATGLAGAFCRIITGA